MLKTNKKAMSLGATILLLLSIIAISLIFVPTVSATPTFTEYVIADNLNYAYDCQPIDVDYDGDIDIVAIGLCKDSPLIYSSVVWYENPGTGSYTNWDTHFIDYDEGGLSIVAYDFSGDNYPSVVIADYDDAYLSFYKNDGTPEGENWTRTIIDTGLQTCFVVQTADIDKDGHYDLSCVAPTVTTCSWYENDGLESFAEHALISSGNSLHGLYIGDINGDTWPDIVTGDGGANDNIQWWKNDGTPDVGAWSGYTIDSNINSPIAQFVVDVDGDGDNDVVSIGQDEGVFAWWENDGTPETGEWVQHDLTSTALHPREIFAIDIDDDGDIDILTAASGDGAGSNTEFAWWENDGNEVFTKRSLSTSYLSSVDIYGFDLDKDGDIDILGCCSESDKVIVWLQDGTGNTAPTITGENPAHQSINVSLQPTCNVTVNDVDGDTMNVTFATNASDAWVNKNTQTSRTNGSVSWSFTDASSRDTRYYWRVYCDDGVHNVSETYYFTTLANEISFLLINNVTNNSNMQLSSSSLNWTKVEGTIRYQLQVSNSSNFSTTFINLTDINETNYGVNYTEIGDYVEFILPSQYDLMDYAYHYYQVKAYGGG